MILAEVGEVTRFPNARKLAAWTGLTPTVRGSDQVVRHGHISKQGSPWLRWILCEAAQTAKRHPEFAGTYAAISRRRGKKIATTAIARKLLTRAYHLLREAERPPPSKAASSSKAAKQATTRTTATATARTASPTGTVTHSGRARKPP